MIHRCFGLKKNFHFCKREGDWLFFCKDHNRQWIGWLATLVFTVAGGAASIYGVIPDLNFGVDSVDIKGQDLIEKTLNKAKLEGVYFKNASSEYVVSKVVVRSDVSASIEGFPNNFLFVSVSPFRATEMTNKFDAGDCKFLGTSDYFESSTKKANLNIQSITCEDESGNYYELSARDQRLSRLGYVSDMDNISNEGVIVERDHGMYSLPAGKNVYIKFDSPIKSLIRKGKNARRG